MVLPREITLVHLPPASLHAPNSPPDRRFLDLGATVFLECRAMGGPYTERNRLWYQ